MAWSRATRLSKTAVLLVITGTRKDSLNNDVNICPCIQHKANLLRTSILTDQRLNRIIENM